MEFHTAMIKIINNNFLNNKTEYIIANNKSDLIAMATLNILYIDLFS